MIWFRKSLILIHRYLGIVLSLFFVMWFITGIGMIYSRGMPRLTPQVRLARLSEVDLERVRLSPSEAAEVGNVGRPGRVALLTVMGRPAYRFANSVTVFADNGEFLADIDTTQAKTIASRFLNVPEDKIQFAGELDKPDQWTLTQGRQLPLYKMTVNDAARTELYVSPQLAEVVQLTTRGSRALAWVSTIPHFLYFAPLRLKNDLWRQVVLWTSGLGCLLALLGITLGVMHFKPSRPLRFSRISSYIPYSGWMRWHYITGLVFGVLTLTWVFSGLLSMEPWAWTERDDLGRGLRQALSGGALDLSDFPAMDAEAWRRALEGRAVKEVEFVRIMNDPYYVVRTASDGEAVVGWPDGGHQPYYVARDPDRERLVISAKPFEVRRNAFSREDIVDRLKAVSPDVPIVDSQSLSKYDSYYYSRDGQSPLPVLRVKFGDPDKTWLYVDPELGQIVGQVHRLNRVERWLYNGLHSLDFPFWYYNRPLWDIGVILLSLGGTAVSGIGLFLGIRRVRRGVKRAVAAPQPARVASD